MNRRPNKCYNDNDTNDDVIIDMPKKYDINND